MAARKEEISATKTHNQNKQTNNRHRHNMDPIELYFEYEDLLMTTPAPPSLISPIYVTQQPFMQQPQLMLNLLIDDELMNAAYRSLCQKYTQTVGCSCCGSHDSPTDSPIEYPVIDTSPQTNPKKRKNWKYTTSLESPRQGKRRRVYQYYADKFQ
jgi:hypothetical protein